MPNDAQWQLDTRQTGEDSLEILIGGRWCIDANPPASGILFEALDGRIRRMRFDTAGLTDWDSGLLTFLASVLKTCAQRDIAADTSGLPPGARRLLAMAMAVPEQKVAGRDKGPQGTFAQVGTAAQASGARNGATTLKAR